MSSSISTNIKNEVKYLKGTEEQYKKLVELKEINPLHFYYLDQKKLYLGFLELTNETAIHALKSELENIYTSKDEFEELKTKIDDIPAVQDSERIKQLENKVTKLNEITAGIGGKNEPTTVVNAINEVKLELTEYIDDALTWQKF